MSAMLPGTMRMSRKIRTDMPNSVSSISPNGAVSSWTSLSPPRFRHSRFRRVLSDRSRASLGATAAHPSIARLICPATYPRTASVIIDAVRRDGVTFHVRMPAVALTGRAWMIGRAPSSCNCLSISQTSWRRFS